MEIEANNTYILILVILIVVFILIVFVLLYLRYSSKKIQANLQDSRTQPIPKSEAFNRIDTKLADQVQALHNNKASAIFEMIDKKMPRTSK